MCSILKYTTEQESIREACISSTSDIIVNAFAGTGKTTTAIYVLSSLKGRKLYLVFNRSMKEEAKRRINDNSVEVYTFHGLAYKHLKVTKYFDDKLVNDFKIRPYEVADILGIDKRKGYWITQLLNIFLYSDVSFESMDKYIISLYKNSFFLQRALELNDLSLEKAVELVRRYVEMVKTGKAPIFHDFYLKDFCQLLTQGKFQNIAQEYEFVVIDESQDVNPILLHFLQSIQSRKMIIGDKHQRIYQFRSAMDINEYYKEYNRFKNVEEMYLTESFRFGDEIASTANIILKFKKEIKNIIGCGPTKNELKKMAIISRKNSVLFKEYLDFYKSDPNLIKYFKFERELSEIIKTIVSVCMIYYGIPVTKLRYYGLDTKYCDYAIINSFRTRKELEEYIRTVSSFSNTHISKNDTQNIDPASNHKNLQDIEGKLDKHTISEESDDQQGMTNISKYVLDEYKTTTDEIVTAYQIVAQTRLNLETISKIIKDYTKNYHHRKAVFLTTAHTAKGQEYEEVYIAEDLYIPDKVLEEYYSLKKQKLNLSNQDNYLINHKRKIKIIEEEINLLYVSVTRPSKELSLSENTKRTIDKMKTLNNS